MPILVSGFGHSGTTLMATMLGAHPQTHLIPHETRWFINDVERGKRKIAEVQEKHSDLIIVEKTPSHMYRIDDIDIPNAKFVVMIRHPYDIAASLYIRYNDIEKAVKRVNKDFNALVSITSDIHIVKYESLIENPKETLTNVCHYSGLRFSKKMLEHERYAPVWFKVEKPKNVKGQGKDHEIRRAWQVQQPLFDGRNRWKTDLNSGEQEFIIDKTFHIAQHFSY
jgi:protein O-GlcNAc transferase